MRHAAATSAVKLPPATLTHADYVRVLRPLIPAEAFRPNPRAYIPITLHLTVIVSAWIACRYTSPAWWPLISLAIAVSLSSLAFLAHDVAHRSVTTNRRLLYPTELVLWSLMFMPATLWRRLHNAHHAHTNCLDDPERRFLPSERSQIGPAAALTTSPHRPMRFNLFCFLYWVFFPLRHGIVALAASGAGSARFVTARPRYSSADRSWIAYEVVFVLALQLGLMIFVRGYLGFVAVSLVPVCLTSAVISWYFFTNHGLKPIGQNDDALAVTTTVAVPKLCNVLHSNFSYHAEHHLFPNMNPVHYPIVSRLLQAHFPARYHRIPISQAWWTLLRYPVASDSLQAG